MSQQPSGWYDDPSNPDMLRYWDGVTWTNHTAPKKSPTASQSTIGLPQQPAPGTSQVPTPTAPVPQGSGWHTQAPGQYQQAPRYTPAPGAMGWATGPTTKDGVPLASWGRRAVARILDWVITGVITGILGWSWMSDLGRWYGNLINQIESGVTPDAATMQSELMRLVMPIAILSVVVGLVYETTFLVTKGATPGKMAAGISVRRTGGPGPLTVVDALKRQVLTVANSLSSAVPGLSTIFSIVVILDYLWPLWDDRRQALHDKIADTQVIVGKRAPRQG
ncbi:hypothetical protein N865_12125 [Intrasporangium oryzae NRRL B-24470]|uniref:RDD family protein n=1 Tax=Intrasporangium oryzae NRRL B-24470 TaxID=1386089 RepID=W9G4G6_9MICO|nr:RDD family protein [Intrasporangium oryzae]EWT01001.1 hypothetical protein N865_12125 [Intrasporangium oryzae NRRL B-24470]